MARIVGQREIKVGGALVKCNVVTATYAPIKSVWTRTIEAAPITYWVDLKSNIVVRQRTESVTITLLRYRLNPKISSIRFAVQPLQGLAERSCVSFSSGGGMD